MTYFGTTGINPTADPDGDGMSNLQECLAGTNPNDAGNRLVIKAYSTTAGGTSAALTCQSLPTRFYCLQESLSLSPGFGWFDSGSGLISPDGATTTRTITDTNAAMRFYRVQATRPLAP